MPVPDFDKHIQEKMQELQLQPSPAVWDAVSARLREKKRRRGLVWIYLLAGLFLAGGTTYLLLEQSSPSPFTKQPSNIQKGKAHPITPQTLNNTLTENGSTDLSGDNTVATRPGQEQEKGISIADSDKAIRSSGQLAPARKQAISAQNKTLITHQQPGFSGKERPRSTASNPSPEKTGQGIPAVSSEQDNSGLPVRPGQPLPTAKALTDPEPYVPQMAAEEPRTIIVAAPGKENGDNTIDVPEPVKKKDENTGKWSWTADFGLGASSLQEDVLKSYNTVANDYMAPATPPSGLAAIQHRPSAVTAGPAFHAGAGVQRKISKRTAIGVGLQYQYHSNRIEIGRPVDSSMTLYNRDQERISVRAAYNGAGNEGEGFYNRYHLIQVPVEFSWDMDARERWKLSTGFAVGYLVGTDALQYNSQAGVYYRDKNSWTRWQTGVFTGIRYGVLRSEGFQLSVGPFASYQLNSIDRTINNKHLLMLGVGARIQFKTKN